MNETRIINLPLKQAAAAIHRIADPARLRAVAAAASDAADLAWADGVLPGGEWDRLATIEAIALDCAAARS